MERRCGDEKKTDLWSKTKRFLSYNFVQTVIAALIIGSIAWAFGAFRDMPITYAKQVDLNNLAIKSEASIKDLDSRKMNKEDYVREHLALRQEIKDDLADLKVSDREQRDLLMKIYNSQQRQYKKVNTE